LVSSILKVVFMGSPDFALPTLDALIDSKRFKPVAVVSLPDRGKGRGKKLLPTPVKARAIDCGLPVREMSKDSYAVVVDWLRELAPDVIVVVAFGIILKKDLLELPPMGCLNVHASLLPKYRGVSPVQAALLAGDPQSGCTTMKIDEGIDTGDVLMQETVDIGPDDTAGTLTSRLADLGADMMVRTLDGLMDGSVEPQQQSNDGSTYAKKIKKTHGKIDWTLGAVDVGLRVRAMTPWPSAYTFHNRKRLILIETTAGGPGDSGAIPGTVLSLAPLTIACGDGTLVIARLKPEGKKAMTPAAYISGHALKPGDMFTNDPTAT
jgi:methionyl-tRNA formyltransferase